MNVIVDIFNGEFDFIFPISSCLYFIGIGVLIFLIRFGLYQYKRWKYRNKKKK